MKRKVIVAKTAGFCMGVKRAVDIAIGVLKRPKCPIFTYGSLIHNPQVTEYLGRRGVVIIDKDSLPKEGTVIIRAHGIAPTLRKILQETGLKFVDATCPFVIKVQSIIHKYAQKGYTILIVGDRGHAEVESYLDCAKGKGIVIEEPWELENIPKRDKLCVVAQTTQDKHKFHRIVVILRKRCKSNKIKLNVYDTICSATANRQKEAIELAKGVDAVVVIGGKNSANTLRLFQICKATGKPTYFVERAGELNLQELLRYNTIGITGGASTPEWVIWEVVDYIKCKM